MQTRVHDRRCAPKAELVTSQADVELQRLYLATIQPGTSDTMRITVLTSCTGQKRPPHRPIISPGKTLLRETTTLHTERKHCKSSPDRPSRCMPASTICDSCGVLKSYGLISAEKAVAPTTVRLLAWAKESFVGGLLTSPFPRPPGGCWVARSIWGSYC